MNFAAIVGNGYEAEDPTTHEMVRHGSNAYALDWDGNGYFAGDVYVGADAGSANGTKLVKESDVPIEYGSGVGSIKTKSFTTTANVTYTQNATGTASSAFGLSTEASGYTSLATGTLTKASGNYSSSFGYYTISNLPSMFVIGTCNIEASEYPAWEANKSYSVGDRVVHTRILTQTIRVPICLECTIANNDAEFTMANWKNIGPQTSRRGDALFVVGNGIATSARSNAYTLDWDGTAHYAGDIYVNCNSDSTGGEKLVNGLKVVRLI